MAKKAFLGIRTNLQLKSQLEEIAAEEERSISQISEILLRIGIDVYRREGPGFIRQFLGQQKPKTPR